MASIEGSRSGWCNRTACRCCGHSGNRATMRPRNNVVPCPANPAQRRDAESAEKAQRRTPWQFFSAASARSLAQGADTVPSATWLLVFSALPLRSLRLCVESVSSLGPALLPLRNGFSKRLFLSSAALLLLLAGAVVWAQPTVFHADTRLVVCHTTVVDKNGHLVTTLTQDAFTVYENGELQPIRIFHREDVPVSMGLIIDNSGSMRDKRAKVESAALTLVKDSNPDDEVFIVNFNDEAFLDNPHGKAFTND